MNFKKFISGVSALTIAASAFAGMAVTANAADTYEILFGTPIQEEGNTTGVTPQTEFTTDSSTKTVNTYGDYKIEDSVLAGNQANGRNYNFSEPVTTGQVHFSAMAYYVGGNFNFWSIKAKDSNGDDYDIVASPYALPSGSGGTTVLRVNGNNVTADYVYLPRNVVYYHDVTIDFTAGKINYQTAYASKGSSGSVTAYSTVSGSADIPDDIVSVVGLTMGRMGSSGNNFYDSVSLYAVTPSASSHVYTINAVDGSGNTLEQLTAGTAEEGEEYGVTGLPEVIENGGTYYRLSSGVTDHAVSYTMGSEDVTQTVTYNADSTIAYYIEGESMTPSRAADSSDYTNSAYSAGAARTMTGSRNLYVNGVVLESGKYSVIVGQGARKSSGISPVSYTGDITIGDIAVGSMTGTMSGTLEETFTNIEIPEGTYTLKAAVTNNALSPVDYIIIQRTGDYTIAPTATAAQYGEDIPADEGYTGDDTVASVFRAEITAGTNAITSVQFTLNDGEKTTDTWSGNITSGPVVFGLIVPMAGADVNNIKAVLNGASYDAYVK